LTFWVIAFFMPLLYLSSHARHAESEKRIAAGLYFVSPLNNSIYFEVRHREFSFFALRAWFGYMFRMNSALAYCAGKGIRVLNYFAAFSTKGFRAIPGNVLARRRLDRK
jgi:hypothetical protein